MRRNKGILFVVSAPSGTGKTTLCRRIVRSIPGLVRSVSYTTRSPRHGEVGGRDYHFVTDKTFDVMIARRAFAEWAVVYENRYGTPKMTTADSLRRGRDLLLEIDVQGAKSIKKIYKDKVVTIFIMPPSLRELRRRLVTRGKDPRKKMEMRLKEAMAEIYQMKFYDFVVVNDSLEDAESKLKAIIVAERQRTERIIMEV